MKKVKTAIWTSETKQTVSQQGSCQSIDEEENTERTARVMEGQPGSLESRQQDTHSDLWI